MGISLGNGADLPLWERSNDAILREFEGRTGHDTGRTAEAYADRIGAQLARFEIETGECPTLREILTDVDLLARVLRCLRSLRGAGAISRSHVSGTRQAFSALVAALPPPPGRSRDEMRTIFRDARRRASNKRGLRLLVPGSPPPRPERFVPSQQDIEAVIEALRLHPDPLAGVSADLVGFLYLTGVRIGAALAMTSDDLVTLPNGRTWIYVHEKARPDRRPVLVRAQRGELRAEWRMQPPGEALWTAERRRLEVAKFRRLLVVGCDRADVRSFSPHRLRTAFASDVAALLDLTGVALAGGWLSERTAEDYVRSRERTFE